MTQVQFMKAVKAASEMVWAGRPRRKEQVIAAAVHHAGQKGLFVFKAGENPDQDPVIRLIARLAGARMDFANLRHDPDPDMRWSDLLLLEEAWERFDSRRRQAEEMPHSA